jgi:hypothetical protein
VAAASAASLKQAAFMKAKAAIKENTALVMPD